MMKRNLTVLLAAGASGLFAMTAAQAQGPAQALEGAYRGMIVCEKIPIAADILHVPFDLIVHGTNAEFARPVFGLKGGRVIGSELGSGTVDADGKIHVTATRVFLGQTVQSEYSGTLTAAGGTLSGKQSWTGSMGEGGRTCHVALVTAPKAGPAVARQ
jgi:hypothetical protein